AWSDESSIRTAKPRPARPRPPGTPPRLDAARPSLARAGSELGLDARIGPIEPGCERLQIGRLHRGATPDAQARRRLDVGTDVVRGALLIEQPREPLHRGGARLERQRLEPIRHDLQADRGARARRWILRQEVDPGRLLQPAADHAQVAPRALDGAREPADALRP